MDDDDDSLSSLAMYNGWSVNLFCVEIIVVVEDVGMVNVFVEMICSIIAASRRIGRIMVI